MLFINSKKKSFCWGALTNKPFAFQNRPWEIEKINYFDFFSSELTNLKVQYNFDFTIQKIPIIRTYAIPKNYISNKIRFILNSVLTQKIIFPYFNLKQTSWFKTIKILKKKLFHLINPTLLIDQTFANYKTILKFKFLTLTRSLNLKFNNSNLKQNYFNYFNISKNLNNLTSLQIFVIINLNLRFNNPNFFFKLRKFNLKHNLIKIVLINSTFNKIYLSNLGQNYLNNLKKLLFSKIKFKFIPILNYFFFFNSLKLNLINFKNLFLQKFKLNFNHFFTLFNTITEPLISNLNLIESNTKLNNKILLNFENDFLTLLTTNNYYKFRVLFLHSATLKKIEQNYQLIIPTLNLFTKSSYFLKNNYFVKLIRLINLTKSLHFLINFLTFFKLIYKITKIKFLLLLNTNFNNNKNFYFSNNNNKLFNTYYYYLTDCYTYTNVLNLLMTKKITNLTKKNDFYFFNI